MATKATPTRAKARRDWKPLFLSTFARTASVTQACKVAKIERSTAYRERQRNEDFAIAWADAEEETTDMLLAEAVRRAIDGSDRLIELLLKAREPELFRERRTVKHEGSLKHEHTLPTETEWHSEVARVLADAGALNGTNGNGHRPDQN